MTTVPAPTDALARRLILDELFDLSLYKALRPFTSGEASRILDELIPIETRHYGFWQEFYRIKLDRLDLARRIKLGFMTFLCRVFGETMVFILLEAIEVYGIRKYLTIWKQTQGTPLSRAVREVLEDEFGHEDKVVSGLERRRISPERIRNIFLGFNDGLVEFLGAVGGFFAAFRDPGQVLIASLTGAVAGALSMAVGVYASSGSEKEMEQTAREKQEFLSGKKADRASGDRPFGLAVVVGISYLFGSMVPIAPVIFGAQSVWISWVCGGFMVILLTMVLSVLSGMRVRRRIATNLAMVTLAVSVAYVAGTFVNRFLR